LSELVEALEIILKKLQEEMDKIRKEALEQCQIFEQNYSRLQKAVESGDIKALAEAITGFIDQMIESAGLYGKTNSIEKILESMKKAGL